MPFLIAVVLAILGGAPDRPHLQPACSRHAQSTLARFESIPRSSIDTDRFTAPNLAAGCRLQGRDAAVVVRLDSAPQAYTRMEREQVEFWQNVEWSHKPAGAAPRPVGHLGLGGYWFPLQSRLLTTDGVRLITIKVRSGSAGPSERKAAAVELARVYLGPLRHP